MQWKGLIESNTHKCSQSLTHTYKGTLIVTYTIQTHLNSIFNPSGIYSDFSFNLLLVVALPAMSLCGCARCLYMAVNKPTCRTRRGLMFQLETSTNRPKWMRGKWEGFQTSPMRPWGKNLLKHLPGLEQSRPTASKLCVFISSLSLVKKISLLPDPLHPREALHPWSHFQNH